MTPNEWNQALELYLDAAEKTGTEQASLLRGARTGNPLVGDLTEELLNSQRSETVLLSGPLFRLGEVDAVDFEIKPEQCYGRYVTREPLGHAGMGEVWAAQDTELNRAVALKFLRKQIRVQNPATNPSPSNLPHPDPLQQITQEARAASALNHPNIITIYEVLHLEDASAIVREFVDGRSLGELKAPIPLPDVLGMGVQIADALAAAHSSTIFTAISSRRIFFFETTATSSFSISACRAMLPPD